MSATLLELRDQLRIDHDILGNDKFPDARLNRIINLAQRYIQTSLNGLGMKKWEKSTGITPVVLTEDAIASSFNNVKTISLSSSLPDLLESPNSIKFIDCTSGIALEVSEDYFIEALRNSYLAPSLVKPIFTRFAGKVYLAPLAISTVKVYYYRVITDLASDASTTEIPVEFEEQLLKKAGVDIDFILQKVQDKQSALQAIDGEIKQAYASYIGKQQEVLKEKETNKQAN